MGELNAARSQCRSPIGVVLGSCRFVVTPMLFSGFSLYRTRRSLHGMYWMSNNVPRICAKSNKLVAV